MDILDEHLYSTDSPAIQASKRARKTARHTLEQDALQHTVHQHANTQRALAASGALHCMLRCVAVHVAVLQCGAVCCSVLRCAAVYYSVCVAVYPSVLHYLAVCCTPSNKLYLLKRALLNSNIPTSPLLLIHTHSLSFSSFSLSHTHTRQEWDAHVW